VIGGCGYGSQPGEEERFRAESEATAKLFETQGSAGAAAKYGVGPTRVQFQNKDPRGFQEFMGYLAEHSAKGSALTLRGVQMRRPLLYRLIDQMRRITMPTLVMTGDEDEPCLDAALLLKRSIPTSGLVVFPRSGHLINLEEPELYNRAVADFLAAVELGRWKARDPRSVVGALLGFDQR
jgi:pimeloyl-ACP methyl ester carboxylesterase